MGRLARTPGDSLTQPDRVSLGLIPPLARVQAARQRRKLVTIAAATLVGLLLVFTVLAHWCRGRSREAMSQARWEKP